MHKSSQIPWRKQDFVTGQGILFRNQCLKAICDQVDKAFATEAV